MKLIKRFIRKQFRKKSRVYIMPTPMGRYFCGLIVLIFLLGVGYSNNLLLGLGLFLFSLNLFWLVEAHFWMSRFKLESIHFQDAEAGQPIVISIRGKHPQEKFFYEKLELEVEDQKDNTIKVHETKNIFHAAASKRGKVEAKMLRLGSDGFLGLFHSWRYIRVNESFWVYPKQQYIPLDHHATDSLSEKNTMMVRTQGRDFHKPYYQGDDAKRIDWKRLAKSEELFIFVGEEAHGSDEVLININTHSPNIETDLSQASYLITNLFSEQRPWRLAIDGQITGPSSGEHFMVQSMRRLAEC